jgi:hypothetical protein
MPCLQVEKMANTLVGLPTEEQARLMADALMRAWIARPDISPERFRPWAHNLLVEVFTRIEELEQTRSTCH